MSTNDLVAAALGQIIRATADAQGMTITELAAKSGVHRVSIQRYIKGDREARLAELSRIADALGVDTGEMVDRAIERARLDAARS